MADFRNIAEQVAAQLKNDGQRWETLDGCSFERLMEQFEAVRTYGELMDDTEHVPTWNRTDCSRYEFADKSAIVECGGGWDIEGRRPFSWLGCEC